MELPPGVIQVIMPEDVERYVNITGVVVGMHCGYCGQPVYKYPAHVRRNRRRGITKAYCNRACQAKGREWEPVRGEAHPQWKGGTDYRRRAIEHYGGFCHTCGYDKEPSLLWVHHKDFGRTNHDLDNLEVLCIRCHLELHLEKDRALPE